MSPRVVPMLVMNSTVLREVLLIWMSCSSMSSVPERVAVDARCGRCARVTRVGIERELVACASASSMRSQPVSGS